MISHYDCTASSPANLVNPAFSVPSWTNVQYTETNGGCRLADGSHELTWIGNDSLENCLAICTADADCYALDYCDGCSKECWTTPNTDHTGDNVHPAASCYIKSTADYPASNALEGL